MAKYELTLIIDTDSIKRGEPFGELLRGACPDSFGLLAPDECKSCVRCWTIALEQGVKHGFELVHVRRLD